MRRGGTNEGNEHQVGLLPKKGWHKRNIEFWGRAVIPSIFRPRSGEKLSPRLPQPEDGCAAVTWIGHASFLIQAGGRNILIDPNWAMWLSIFKRVRQPGICIQDLPPIDLVLVTHAHHDHLHLRSLREVANRQPILVPFGVGSLVRRRGFEVSEMGYWESWSDGDLKVTFTPSQHWGARFVHDTHRGFGGYVIETPGSCIYHAGDTAMFDGFSTIGEKFEIGAALLPIGAYQAPSGREVHMNPEEAVTAFQQLGAETMVPMHYGTFPLGGEPIHEPVERLECAS